MKKVDAKILLEHFDGILYIIKTTIKEEEPRAVSFLTRLSEKIIPFREELSTILFFDEK